MPTLIEVEGFIARCGDDTLMFLRSDVAHQINRRNDEDPTSGPGEPWDPWRALRQQPDVRLRWADFPSRDRGRIEICVEPAYEQATIYLSRSLIELRDQRSTLTHELIHLERGVLEVGFDQGCREAEEAVVRAITRDRLATYERSTWRDRPEAAL